MAWSVPIWKIYGFPKVSLNLERFVPKHATAHIHQRYLQWLQTEKSDLFEKNILKRNFKIDSLADNFGTD